MKDTAGENSNDHEIMKQPRCWWIDAPPRLKVVALAPHFYTTIEPGFDMKGDEGFQIHTTLI